MIAELENQVKNLDAEIGKLAPGKAQSEMRQQAAEVKAELAAETEALKNPLKAKYKQPKKAHVSFRTRIRGIQRKPLLKWKPPENVIQSSMKTHGMNL